MDPSILFAGGVTITLLLSLAVVIYLRASLSRILTELCGTRERAAFWTAFSSITVILVPLIFAMQNRPDPASSGPAIYQIADQLKWALAGLVVSVITLGWIIARFIPRHTPAPFGKTLRDSMLD